MEHLRRRSRRRLLGSSITAVAIGALGVWSFFRCASLPDERCLDEGIRPDLGRISTSDQGCMSCYCDASGELHCIPRGCSADAGVMTDVIE